MAAVPALVTGLPKTRARFPTCHVLTNFSSAGPLAALTPVKHHGQNFVRHLHYGGMARSIRVARMAALAKMATSYGNWFEPAITAKDGKLSVPASPGMGIKDMHGLLSGAVEV